LLSLKVGTHVLVKFADVHALLLLSDGKPDFVVGEVPGDASAIEFHCFGVKLVHVADQRSDIDLCATNGPIPAIAAPLAQILRFVGRGDEYALSRELSGAATVRWPERVACFGDKRLRGFDLAVADRLQLGNFNDPSGDELQRCVLAVNVGKPANHSGRFASARAPLVLPIPCAPSRTSA